MGCGVVKVKELKPPLIAFDLTLFNLCSGLCQFYLRPLCWPGCLFITDIHYS